MKKGANFYSMEVLVTFGITLFLMSITKPSISARWQGAAGTER